MYFSMEASFVEGIDTGFLLLLSKSIVSQRGIMAVKKESKPQCQYLGVDLFINKFVRSIQEDKTKESTNSSSRVHRGTKLLRLMRITTIINLTGHVTSS